MTEPRRLTIATLLSLTTLALTGQVINAPTNLTGIVDAAVGTIAVMLGPSNLGPFSTIQFDTNPSPTAGGGIVWSATPKANGLLTVMADMNSAKIPTKSTVQSGALQYIESNNGTIAYTYNFGSIPGGQALTSYTKGMGFYLKSDAQCASFCTLNIDKVGLVNIKQSDGSTDPGGVYDFTRGVPIRYDGSVFRIEWQTPAH